MKETKLSLLYRAYVIIEFLNLRMFKYVYFNVKREELLRYNRGCLINKQFSVDFDEYLVNSKRIDHVSSV